jgi:GT2 family glycosyltransferase
LTATPGLGFDVVFLCGGMHGAHLRILLPRSLPEESRVEFKAVTSISDFLLEIESHERGVSEHVKPRMVDKEFEERSTFSGTNAAVVVTFNRKHLLSECLAALLNQSRPLDAIFVVDNASTDGTQKYLQELGFLANPVIRYIELKENAGGAGGFAAGMAAAHKGGFGWIWVMDDDTEPHRDSLEKMEIWKRYPAVAAIANLKVDRLGRETTDGLRLYPRDKSDSVDYPKVRFSSFVGLLIRSSAINNIGLPKAEFFIHNDDTEYCLRLRSSGDIALAFDSVVVHKEVGREQKQRKVLSHVFYQKDIESFCFDYFGHRNFAWIQQNHCKNPFVRYSVLLGRFACFAAAIVAFDSDHRWLRLKILVKSNRDGILGNFDNGFPRRLREQLKIQKLKG